MSEMSIYPETATIMAPLSGYTDPPFRRACRRHGCRYAFTPLVDVGSLVYNNPRLPGLLARGEDEPWLGIQLVGSDLTRIKEAVRRLADHHFEVLDFNMGCPVGKVMRRGAGAAMGKTPEYAADCVAAIAELSPFPVTGKIRILDPENPEPTVHFARLLAAAGCRALTVHGRVWTKLYSGPVACEIVDAVRQALPIPVIANGGVFDARSADELRQKSGCSRIMIARGAIGNPWIFRELAGGASPTHDELCAELTEHLREMVAFHGEETGLRIGRKIIAAYLGGRGYPRELRASVMGLSTWADFADFMRRVHATGPTRVAPSG